MQRSASRRATCITLLCLPIVSGRETTEVAVPGCPRPALIVVSYGLEEALAQQIQLGTAKHLALQHLQTVDVPCDGTVAPGPCHPRFDCRIVVAQPLRTALSHREGAGGRAGEPGIQAVGLTGAHEVGTVPREADRLGEVSLLRHELRALMCVVRDTRLRTPQHEPGGPPRRELAVLGLRHDGQRVPGKPLAGSEPLGLP